MTEIVGSPDRRPSVTALPDAHRVYAMIMAAAERQIATAAVARPILAAGLGDQLRDLVQQIAANAANPIAADIEDALSPTP